jgi:hypothetical protein
LIVRRALIVTITEGVELQPQAAFLSSALRALGFKPELLPTDFCTTQDSFQTAVRASNPDAVLFVDALEWREILATLSGFAVEAIAGPVVVDQAPGDLAALRAALRTEPGPVPPLTSLPLDYALFGGAALVGRAMGCSLFGDVGTVALLATRPVGGSPTAAIARLEGPVSPLLRDSQIIEEHAALAPLEALRGSVRAVEWWDEPEARPIYAARVKEMLGCPQTCRSRTDYPMDEFDQLRADGITRVVYDCDAIDDLPELRLPGAAGPTGSVAAAAVNTKKCGLEVGVLFVIGLPGERALHTKARCDLLRRAGIDRVRVVPFEPTGGTPTYDWCVERGLWPPKDNRWNRELYQPLEQPQKAEWPMILEEALMLVADVEARAGAPA